MKAVVIIIREYRINNQKTILILSMLLIYLITWFRIICIFLSIIDLKLF